MLMKGAGFKAWPHSTFPSMPRGPAWAQRGPCRQWHRLEATVSRGDDVGRLPTLWSCATSGQSLANCVCSFSCCNVPVCIYHSNRNGTPHWQTPPHRLPQHPKIEPQKWAPKLVPKFWKLEHSHGILQEQKACQPGPLKQEKPTLKAETLLTLWDHWKIAGANYQCPSNWKVAQQWENQNQMNIPNFCSRMRTEHANSKAEFFSSSKWSRKPLYFEVLFFGPDFGQREHIKIRLTALMESILKVKSKNFMRPPHKWCNHTAKNVKGSPPMQSITHMAAHSRTIPTLFHPLLPTLNFHSSLSPASFSSFFNVTSLLSTLSLSIPFFSLEPLILYTFHTPFFFSS